MFLGRGRKSTVRSVVSVESLVRQQGERKVSHRYVATCREPRSVPPRWDRELQGQGSGKHGEENAGAVCLGIRTSIRMRWWSTTRFRMFAIVIHAIVIRLPNIRPWAYGQRPCLFDLDILTHLSPRL